jgi:hypothetical protein
LLAALRKTLQN